MLSILNELAATSKRTEKEAILTALDTDQAELLKRVGIATYNESINYYVKKYPRPKTHSATLTLTDALESLPRLTSRELTGKAALTFLTALEGHLSEEDGEVLNRIIVRDFKAGVTTSTLNKIWPDLIYVEPYERCSSFNEKNLRKIKFPAYSQTKADGLYVNIVVENGKVVYRSRNGLVKNFNDPVKDALFLRAPNMVFMGEAIGLYEDGTTMPRTEGNGYIDSEGADVNRIAFVLWNVVPLAEYRAHKSVIDYKTRMIILKGHLKGFAHDSIRLCDTKVVNSVQDIIDHFKEQVDLGNEGTVIKNQHGTWESGTSPDQIKCKIEFECELRIKKVNEGTGKNAGRMGALECESEDGKVKVAVGIGFSDKDRDALYTDEILEQILGVKANDIVKDRNSETFSLFLPRSMGIRTDKTTADTYDRIKEQMEAFVHTLEVIGT